MSWRISTGYSTSKRRGLKRASSTARRRLAHPTASAGATAPSSAGVYTFEQERPRFHRSTAPTRPELQRLLRIIATRVTRALEGQGLLIRDDETPSLDLEPADGFEHLLGAAVPLPHRHRPPRRAQGPDPAHRRVPTRRADNPCIAQLSGILPPCRHALPSP